MRVLLCAEETVMPDRERGMLTSPGPHTDNGEDCIPHRRPGMLQADGTLGGCVRPFGPHLLDAGHCFAQLL
ncbi:hypothetical protein BH23CHL1_BH23CHL1_16670 [soil metagenome]